MGAAKVLLGAGMDVTLFEELPRAVDSPLVVERADEVAAAVLGGGQGDEHVVHHGQGQEQLGCLEAAADSQGGDLIRPSAHELSAQEADASRLGA